ncbi:hypothetical protein SEA_NOTHINGSPECIAL_78 [Mycobacterium phage NothingSpecial]|nr:hypothetical protein SEA_NOTHINGSPECIAL_78 [Mycobacterium phage NothingSpecial]
MRWVAVWFATGMAVFGMALAVAYSPPAHAEVSARCYAHLAEHPGTTAGADRRYHLEHGEFSPCTEQDANESKDREGVATRGVAPSPEDDKHDDDKKSRYCRKHWYC